MFDVQITFVMPHWLYWGGLLLFPLVMMLFVRRDARRREALPEADEGPLTSEELEERIFHDRALSYEDLKAENGFTRLIDRISGFTGVFVAYWTVIAVVTYFYEVAVRYFFDSPTNWAHESMFLMFGMQYLIAGAYAYLHDAHVRVDLFYSKAGPRGKAALDIFTSVFFLVFTLALLWTGWTFFTNSVSADFLPFGTGYANERSFTEWQVAYWPVKGTIFLGAVFLLLQGLGRLVKDILVMRRVDALEEEGRHV
ncbi:TRAP transporter small permease subunit [Caenispirillum salinarum]|uniref:TRAP transporter small permease subunit n=1 Tax=Caenispirillum salinarum TaxID=859058 RepID=UPI000300B8F6|nr:TRAP transporter small permease subunit [Caenispirillum salinarum]